MTTIQQCSVGGCEREHCANGYCNAHYRRVQKHGDPQADIPIRVQHVGPCVVPSCDRPVVGWGLCQPHYQRQKMHDDLRPNDPIIPRGRQICSVDGCDRIVSTRGWCDTHYTRWKRYGTVDADRPVQYKFKGEIPEGLNWCGRCQTLKPVDEFKPSKHTKSGLTGRCATCVVDGFLILTYNITLADYWVMFEKQNGVCATCHQPETSVDPRYGKVLRLAVDHDHTCCPGSKSCGECVRGLLCSSCNRTLGLMRDDAATLGRMADYIIGHKERMEIEDGDCGFSFARDGGT